MFVEITNEPRDYAWGSASAIAEFQGRAPSGGPEAELWLGTHPGSPSRVVGREGTLRDVVGELPFMVKILAAGTPLSLQAHPTTEQAQEGFARENAAGIPLDAPTRTYKDPFAKPEMLYALSDEFRALCGFRPVAETRAALSSGGVDHLLPELRSDDDIRPVFEWLLSGDPAVSAVVAEVSAASVGAAGESWRTVRGLAAHFPGDPGIVISLLLHSVVLRRGEAIYLPPGNIHAYQEGLGIELLGGSDNVLRGGLTPKHVDVQELLRVVDFTSGPEPRLEPLVSPTGDATFAPEGAGWMLTVLSSGSHVIRGAGILVVLDGVVADLPSGAAAYLSDETLTVGPGGLVALAQVTEPARRE